MREVTIGGQTITLVATPFTLFIYRQEFSEGGKKADLLADLFGTFDSLLSEGITPADLADLDQDTEEGRERMQGLLARMGFSGLFEVVYPVLQAAWAMAKTHHYPRAFPVFEEWLKRLGDTDLFSLVEPVWLEAQRGFFRGAATGAKAETEAAAGSPT
jgi:hypothetical protein